MPEGRVVNTGGAFARHFILTDQLCVVYAERCPPNLARVSGQASALELHQIWREYAALGCAVAYSCPVDR